MRNPNKNSGPKIQRMGDRLECLRVEERAMGLQEMSAYRILFGRPEGKRPFEIPKAAYTLHAQLA
jgi:hypothetical protein